MKYISSLVAADLERAPVWVYRTAPWSPEDPEAAVIELNGERLTEWVEQTDLRSLEEGSDGVYIAATEFVLATGERLFGFCSPSDPSGLDYVQPVILSNEGLVRLFPANVPGGSSQSTGVAANSRLDAAAFPVAFRCLVPCDAVYLTGTIPAITEKDRAT